MLQLPLTDLAFGLGGCRLDVVHSGNTSPASIPLTLLIIFGGGLSFVTSAPRLTSSKGRIRIERNSMATRMVNEDRSSWLTPQSRS